MKKLKIQATISNLDVYSIFITVAKKIVKLFFDTHIFFSQWAIYANDDRKKRGKNLVQKKVKFVFSFSIKKKRLFFTVELME